MEVRGANAMPALFTICERLNQTFSSSSLESMLPAPSLFEPTPRHTLLRAFWRLGVARELEEFEAIAALPLGIQVAIRALVWVNLNQACPQPIQWLWTPGRGHELLTYESRSELAHGMPIAVVLRTPHDHDPPTLRNGSGAIDPSARTERFRRPSRDQTC